MLTNDERDVLERLEAWELQIQRILLAYGHEGNVPSLPQNEVRALYWSLKLDLRAAVKVGETEEGRAQMTDAERKFLYPAVQAAAAHLSPRVDARPEEWHQSLCDALSDFSDAVVGLTDKRSAQ
jgi:hypothetical protein